MELARATIKACEANRAAGSTFEYLYPLELGIAEKIEKIARDVYHADGTPVRIVLRLALRQSPQPIRRTASVLRRMSSTASAADEKKAKAPNFVIEMLLPGSEQALSWETHLSEKWLASKSLAKALIEPAMKQHGALGKEMVLDGVSIDGQAVEASAPAKACLRTDGIEAHVRIRLRPKVSRAV